MTDCRMPPDAPMHGWHCATQVCALPPACTQSLMHWLKEAHAASPKHASTSEQHGPLMHAVSAALEP